MNIRPSPLLLSTLACAVAPLANAAVLLTQNFDSSPENYTFPAGSAPFRVQADAPTKYFAPSNTAGITLNPAITGNATTYLAVQNIDADAGTTFTFTTIDPAQLDFTVNGAGFALFSLGVDLAGLPNAELENYVRAFSDVDGDGTYETPIFNFVGAGNTAYTDLLLGPLSPAFATFTTILPTPTALDGNLRIRLEVFNDTQSLNEAVGIDNIVINGNPIPEPSVLAIVTLACAGLIGRRRRS